MQWLQQWDDVLFLHYAADSEAIAPHLAPGLEVDTFDGQAWLSLVFFRLKLRPAGWPFVPGLSSLLELNVRTYVRCNEQPGIVFLRMYADNGLAILAARLLTPLRYTLAKMSANSCSEHKRRLVCQPRGTAGRLEAHFQVIAQPRMAQVDSLDAWLMERYRLYTASPSGELLAADVEHAPWRIAPVRIVTIEQSILDELPFRVTNTALAHYSPGVAATFNSFYRVRPNPRLTPAAPSRRARAAGHYAGR